MEEPDQRDIVGYSLVDPEARNRWIALVRGLSQWIDDEGLKDKVVFHGTSRRLLAKILEDGLEPTDVELAVGPLSGMFQGSFWGDVQTAAAYAEDTVKEREGKGEPGCGEPVLIAVLTDRLEKDCLLYPDLATLDFPMKGLTRLDDPEVQEDWLKGFMDKDWRDGLRDLGAIVATHEFYLDPDDFFVVDSLDAVKERIDGLCRSVERP